MAWKIGAKPMADIDVPVRVWDRLARSIRQEVPEDPMSCWIWMGGTRGGYGRVQIDGRKHTVHRVAWQFFRGPIGDLTLDHTCRNRACCNPWHMDACPLEVNSKRSPTYQSNKTHCKQGHSYTLYGRQTKRGRDCRECERLKRRRLRATARAMM